MKDEQKLIVHKVSSDDAPLGDFIRRCACREEALLQQVAALTAQVDRRNSNIQHMGQQHQQIQVALNAANTRIRDLEQAYGQSEKLRRDLENQVRMEEENHKTTQESLGFEFSQHAKAAMNEKRYWSTVKVLLGFLGEIQVTSAEGKGMTLANLPNGNTLEALMTEVEGRDQLVNPEETVRYGLEELGQTVDERSTIFDDTSSKDEVEAEDNKHERYVMDHDMKDVKEAVPVRRRAKAERKGSRAHLTRKGL